MSENQDAGAILKEIAEGNLKAWEFLAAVNVASMEASGLDPETLMLVRMAALAAMDAPEASWMANLEVAAETDLSIEQVRGVLMAVAPLIGTPRVISAAGKIQQVFGQV
jgi:alkylhydroperoxidase/carboxymuconolactone decarboxylase family protein YurZ